MYKFIPVLLALLYSCIDRYNVAHDFKEPSLKVYEDMFISDAASLDIVVLPLVRLYFKDLSLSEYEYDRNTLGYAIYPERVAIINIFYWGGLSEREKKWVVYHLLVRASCAYFAHKEGTLMDFYQPNDLNKKTDEEFNDLLLSGIAESCT